LKTATDRLQGGLLKTCSVSRTEIALANTVLASLAPPATVARLHLNDPSCVAVDNGTHHVVTSHSTACGSTALTYGTSPMYRNNLVAVFADDGGGGGPLAGQEVR
jgi:hypothetical protein